MNEPSWHVPYITSGERVLWQTEPEKRRLSIRWITLGALALMVALCIPVGFLLYSFLMRQDSPHVLSVVASLMFSSWLALAVCQELVPWLLRQLGRRQPEFVVTDKRILRCRGGLVDSLLLHQLPPTTLTQEADDTATLTFWPAIAHNAEQDSGCANLGSMVGFTMPHIHQADRLMDVLQDVRVKHEPLKSLAEDPLIPLEQGERLLWQGMPVRTEPHLQQLLSGRYIAGESDRWMGGLWGILIVTGFLTMVLSEIGWQLDMWPMYLFLLVMLIASIATLVFPLARYMRLVRGTQYVLTDRRLIRRINGFVSEFNLQRENNTPVYLARGQSGTGTLMLCSIPVIHGGTTPSLTSAAAPMEGFQLRSIPDAARVAELIAAVQAQNA